MCAQAGAQAYPSARAGACVYVCTGARVCAYVCARVHGLILPTLLYINPFTERVHVSAYGIWRAHNAHVR